MRSIGLHMRALMCGLSSLLLDQRYIVGSKYIVREREDLKMFIKWVVDSFVKEYHIAIPKSAEAFLIPGELYFVLVCTPN